MHTPVMIASSPAGTVYNEVAATVLALMPVVIDSTRTCRVIPMYAIWDSSYQMNQAVPFV